MPKVRVTDTNYTNRMRNVTAIPDHYVALPAQISATHAITEDGVKVIKAGTCVTNASSLDGRSSGLTPVTGEETFDGVIFTDTEVLQGETEVNVAVLVHGFVKYAALQKVGSAVPASGTDMIFVIK